MVRWSKGAYHQEGSSRKVVLDDSQELKYACRGAGGSNAYPLLGYEGWISRCHPCGRNPLLEEPKARLFPGVNKKSLWHACSLYELLWARLRIAQSVEDPKPRFRGHFDLSDRHDSPRPFLWPPNDRNLGGTLQDRYCQPRQEAKKPLKIPISRHCCCGGTSNMFGLLGTESEVVPPPLRLFEAALQPPLTPTPPSR